MPQRTEVPELRTRNSRTFALSDGSFVQELAAAPINFRTDAGRWAPIDNTLERRADGSLENAANSLDLTVPAQADDPVEVVVRGRSLAFELVGASPTSTASIDDEEATFHDALPGVDVVYESRSSGVKETLILDGPDAADDLRFDVATPGLSARLSRSGAIEFVDASGTMRFGFAAPWMQDAAGVLSRAVSYEVERTEAGARVVLNIDADWLGAPEREFPVGVDPTVYHEPYAVCQFANGSLANVDDCSAQGPVWVGRDSRHTYRAAIPFPTPELPDGALVLAAQTSFELAAQSAAEPSTLDLFGFARELNPDATWNTSDGVTPWTTPGGDLEPERESRRTLQPTAVGTLTGLGTPRLVQGWIDESKPNNGLLIKAADETVSHVDVLDEVHMTVRYRDRLGLDASNYPYDHRELSDGTRVDVNLGSGNVVISADDFGLEGLDDQLTVDRIYNSLDDVRERGIFGIGWRGDFGTISLERNPVDGSYAFNGPTGLDGLFARRPNGSFAPPEGWAATLTEQPSAGTVTVSYEDTDEQWLFEESRTDRFRLIRRWYPSEAGATATYDSNGKLSILRDPEGNTATFTWDGAEMVSVRDQFGDERLYDYDSAGRLIRFTSATRAVTLYEYWPNGKLQQITVPDGSGVFLEYHSTGELETLTPLDSQSRPGPQTTYSGGQDYTTVVTPGEATTTYHYDRRLFTHTTETGTAPPSIRLSGPVAGAHRSSLPVGQHTLSVVANDLDGIDRLRVEGPDGEDAELCADPCGTSVSSSWTLDTYDYGPGPHRVRVIATDAAGNRSERALQITLPESHDNSYVDPVTGPDPDAGVTLTAGPCEALNGVGSARCSVVNEDPLDDGASTFGAATSIEDAFSTAAAPHPIRYGIAQDFERDQWTWPTESLVRTLAPKDFRRIVPFNIADTRDEVLIPRGLTAEQVYARLKYEPRFREFERQYRLIFPHDGEPVGQLIVSFGEALCPEVEDPNDRTPDCRGNRPENSIPDELQYKRSLRNFLTLFPKVNVISSWNEPNLKRSALRPSSPTGPVRGPPNSARGPVAAANITLWATDVCMQWNASTRGAANCTVMAAELQQSLPMDNGAWLRYLRVYVRQIKAIRETRRPSFSPRIWAFHPYNDVRFDTAQEQLTRVEAGRFRSGRFVKATAQMDREILQGDTQIWFTEVGSRVDAKDVPASPQGQAPNRRNNMVTQAAEVEHLFSRLASARRLRRILYFSPYTGQVDLDSQIVGNWDSALTGNWDTEGRNGLGYGGLDAQPRPSYCVALSYMNPGLPEEEKPELCTRREGP